MRASTLLLALLIAAPTPAAAQTTTPPPAQTPPTITNATRQTPPPPSRQTPPPTATTRNNLRQKGEQARNIRLDLAITDTFGGSPSRKTVSMLILDGENGMIRTSNRLPGAIDVQLNVDATAAIVANGPSIRVAVTFEYMPAHASDEAVAKGLSAAGPSPGRLHESINVRLTSGKPLMVSQSADPASDRKVTVELTATILDNAEARR